MRIFVIGAALAASVAINPIGASAESSCEQVDFNGIGTIDDVNIHLVEASIGKSVGHKATSLRLAWTDQA